MSPISLLHNSEHDVGPAPPDSDTLRLVVRFLHIGRMPLVTGSLPKKTSPLGEGCRTLLFVSPGSLLALLPAY